MRPLRFDRVILELDAEGRPLPRQDAAAKGAVIHARIVRLPDGRVTPVQEEVEEQPDGR
jgi:hypothetical protein